MPPKQSKLLHYFQKPKLTATSDRLANSTSADCSRAPSSSNPPKLGPPPVSLAHPARTAPSPPSSANREEPVLAEDQGTASASDDEQGGEGRHDPPLRSRRRPARQVDLTTTFASVSKETYLSAAVEQLDAIPAPPPDSETELQLEAEDLDTGLIIDEGGGRGRRKRSRDTQDRFRKLRRNNGGRRGSGSDSGDTSGDESDDERRGVTTLSRGLGKRYKGQVLDDSDTETRLESTLQQKIAESGGKWRRRGLKRGRQILGDDDDEPGSEKQTDQGPMVVSDSDEASDDSEDSDMADFIDDEDDPTVTIYNTSQPSANRRADILPNESDEEFPRFQTMLHFIVAVILANGAVTAHHHEDDFLFKAYRHFERRISTVKESVVYSSAWLPNFRCDPDGKCEACHFVNRTATATAVMSGPRVTKTRIEDLVRLALDYHWRTTDSRQRPSPLLNLLDIYVEDTGGDPYRARVPNRGEVGSNESSDDNQSSDWTCLDGAAPVSYRVGQICAARSGLYHAMHHYFFALVSRMITAVSHTLADLGLPDACEHELLDSFSQASEVMDWLEKGDTMAREYRRLQRMLVCAEAYHQSGWDRNVGHYPEFATYGF
ncbi:hypothetical protein IWQ60_008640 [Tieghemiomyces parasiticus]|uniref:Uncharacterized protein n=1 Tax=Tieghemiomyces parasiticus TaxID=78921 RepID=A0A9W7ZS35_9FUNG|nr:hypothetical protein IWQ60_008640 [Tieghemiomyces parasiticus]